MTLTALAPRTSKNHKWKDEEREIIRRDFAHTHESCRKIAAYLSRLTGEEITEYAVRGQVSAMGIAKRDDRKPWTLEEKERLAELIHRYEPRRIAKLMHRSLNSVVVQSKRLNASRRVRDDWFTKREVCEILGMDHHWVQRRIDSGALVATYHHGERPSQLGARAWHIEAKDLANFIRTYPEELNGRNVDLIMIVELIAGINHNQHNGRE